MHRIQSIWECGALRRFGSRAGRGLGTASIRLLPILLSPQIQSAAELRHPDRPDALALRRARRPMASTGTGRGGQPRNLGHPAPAASMDGRDAPPPWTLRQINAARVASVCARDAQAKEHVASRHLSVRAVSLDGGRDAPSSSKHVNGPLDVFVLERGVKRLVSDASDR